MGNEAFNDSNPFQYGVFSSSASKPGESPILRRPDTINTPLSKVNYIDRYTQLECVEYYMKTKPNNQFLGTREYFSKEKKYGEFKWKTHSEIYSLSKIFLYGITKLELCPEILVNDELLGGEKKMRFMGIYSRNREEWIIGSFGCQMDSITIVTLYDTLGMKSIEFILNQTEMSTIIAEEKNLEKILKLKKDNQLGKVKNIIYLHCNEETENLEEIKNNLINRGINLFSYEEIISIGQKCIDTNDENILNKTFKKTLPDDVFLICYTSGTMDNPKGAMVTEKTLLLATNVMYTIGYNLSESDSILSFLPLAHIMEQIILSLCLVYGSKTGFFSGNINRLVEDMQVLKPTYFCAVPRVFEKIYNTIKEKINKKGPIVKKLFNAALKLKISNYEKYGKLSHALFDPIFFNQIRNFLGGNMKWLLSGGAALQKEILQELKVMVGCPMVQGYGQTENAGSALLNSIYDFNPCGTTGGLQNTSELKLIDLPEYGYFSTDVNSEGIPEPRGEICFRGGTLFKGYFKNKEETEKIFDDDGWYHSGDVGAILTKNGNALKIIDRAKSLFKLSQGEYVAPDRVQIILINSKYVNQIYLYGESSYSYAIALVYPALKECIGFLKKNKIMGDINYDKITIDELCNNKELKKEIIKDCNEVGRSFDLKGFEIPKKVIIIKEPFSPENNLMTPTLKLKSKSIKMKYINELKDLYENNKDF